MHSVLHYIVYSTVAQRAECTALHSVLHAALRTASIDPLGGNSGVHRYTADPGARPTLPYPLMEPMRRLVVFVSLLMGI